MRHDNRMSPIDRSRTTRRSFLATSAVATIAAPQILTANKSGARIPVTGSGGYVFEMFHDWPRLTEGRSWQTTQDIAVSRDGFVFIIHNGSAGGETMDTVFVFDPDGKFVRSFGKEFDGGSHGIDLRVEEGQEFVYICDRKHLDVVVKTSLEGEEVWRTGKPKKASSYDESSPFRPTNVAFAPDGGFYVADGYGSFFIHQYDKDAHWVRCWG